MTATVAAYAAPAAGQPLERTEVERRPVGDHDVRIDIRYCGICHSDIHQVRDEWGPGLYPMVPGHEIAGIVSEVGSGVTRYAVGDRVGVGCFVDSCRECDQCRNGSEQHCTGNGEVSGTVLTYNSDRARDGRHTQGGYSTGVVVDENYVLRVPDNLALDAAAPLLCAGITLYAPLRQWQAGPGKKVAIVGLGGLGHVGVKLAVAMGAEVTVLSQSLKKREDGLRLGAVDYYATSDADTFDELAGRFDQIVSTVSASINLDDYVGLLRAGGTLSLLGVPDEPQTVTSQPLTTGGKSVSGSVIGGIALTQEMLDFCGEHDITAEVELIGADAINDAYERVMASDVRYRFVIDTASLAA